mgnify:CR=1 FL=1
MTKKCWNCGTENSDQADYCRYCQTEIRGIASNDVIAQARQEEARTGGQGLRYREDTRASGSSGGSGKSAKGPSWWDVKRISYKEAIIILIGASIITHFIQNL